MNILSNIVTKTWYWNGLILGIDNHTYANWDDGLFGDRETDATLNILSAGDYTLTEGNPNPGVDDEADGRGYSKDKMVFIWARDRDGLPDGMEGARVDINNITEGPYILSTGLTHAVSQYNYVTKGIYVDGNGFLTGTHGVRTSATTGYCFFKEPSELEKVIFTKNISEWQDVIDPVYGKDLNPDDFVVAGFDLYYSGTCDSTVEIMISSYDLGYPTHLIGQVDYTINVNFGVGNSKYVYPLDDPIIAGDANNDGEVNALDIAAIENMIMELEDADVNGDATQNGQINMGDVVKVIRMIRNLK
jgi:hypothetical protein